MISSGFKMQHKSKKGLSTTLLFALIFIWQAARCCQFENALLSWWKQPKISVAFSLLVIVFLQCLPSCLLYCWLLLRAEAEILNFLSAVVIFHLFTTLDPFLSSDPPPPKEKTNPNHLRKKGTEGFPVVWSSSAVCSWHGGFLAFQLSWEAQTLRRAELQLQKTQYLQLGQSRGQYYGGSLPNVNQIGNSAMDLPFQTPFQSSALDTSRTTRHHGLVDRVYRDRNRLGSPHRRPLSVDKHGRQVDSCPYGTVYLSPPSDTSWRRTNSDSALHQSTMTPAQQESFSGGSQDMQQKRVLLLTVPGMEETTSDADKTLSKQGWDTKKTGSSRPKSCEVPGINIFPSAEQENTTALIPGTHNTGGSLPDLTNIHFPSPLPTPLDPEESSFPALSSSSSTGNLAANLTHLGISSASQGMTTTPAPSQHRQPSVSPLSLGADSRRPQSQQMSPTLSPLSPITQAVAMDALSLEQQLPPYPFFTQTSSQQQQQPAVASSLPQTPPLLQSSALQRGPQLPPLSVTVPSTIPQSPPGSQSQPSMGIDINSHSSMLGSVFGDSYYEQQMTARQANALSHQLEQFNMIENAISSNSLYSPCSTLNYSQAAMMGLTGSHGSLQDSQQLNYSSHSNIPNIILTVTGESPPSLSKELTSSLAGVGDVSFDTDSQFPLDELKIDPLTLDGLHMLNDPDMVLTDPATEDTFRMDRL